VLRAARHRLRLGAFIVAAASLSACRGHGGAGAGAAGGDGGAAGEAAGDAGGAANRCGELACLRFATPEQAFEKVLSTDPRVLAVGETHAQKDLPPGVTSSTKRFTERLLPVLARRGASDLVVELWLGNASCKREVKEVAKRQEPVTTTQAATDQNEFIALGDAAKKLGVAPHALVPSCDEYARILDAGSGDIDAMLTMIARLTGDDLEKLTAAHAQDGKLVVAYGGAMHNDLAPRAGFEAWTFGPRLAKATGNRYVELDLVVPEAVKDTDAWRSLPWFKSYDPKMQGPGETLLLFVAPGSYVLVFPRAASASQ
jgi:hypothetical protein